MTQQDQYDAMLEILYKLLDGDIKKFQVSPETPGDIVRFLHGRPDRKELNRAMLDVYTAIKARQRRRARRREKR